MHTFRKYISNRGSALFMVISTMTALMITCMAMYFTVLASRSTIYAVFNQKQSYQNSSSIYDMVVNNGLSPTSDLYKQMEKMAVGETLTTPLTEDEYLGRYTVTITKLSEKEYDIIVSSTVDGVTETVHNVISITNSVEEVPLDGGANVSLAPTFAATGYVPNDVYLERGFFFTDMFFDNEITYFGAFSKDNLKTGGDISCGGSVVIGNGFYWDPKDNQVANHPITFAIRNNLTYQGSNLQGYPGSKIYIGGNLYQHDKIDNFDIYVNGDLYIYGGNNTSSTRYFVNGNVYFTGSLYPNNLYCNGDFYDHGTINNSHIINKWDTIEDGTHVGVTGPGEKVGQVDGRDVITYDSMLLELDNKTQTNTYYKWTIKDSDISRNGTLNKQKIVVEDYNKPAYITINEGEWGTGCDVTDVEIKGSGPAFIIIDTGKDPDNVYTMRLEANRTGPDGKKNLFSWTGERGDDVRVRVLVKGRGSVVFDVPEGVTYQDTDNSVVCHYNWWIISGGDDPASYTATGASNSAMYIKPGQINTTDNTKLNYYIIRNDPGCSGTPEDAVEDGVQVRCTRTVLRNKAGALVEEQCGEVKKTIKCAKHGFEVTYCPVCEKAYVYDQSGKLIICNNHVDNSKVEERYNNDSGLHKTYWDMDGNKVIYPTTNIYLVSSVESASFRFGYKPNDTELVYNSMIGYVYAPYVTFFAKSDDKGFDVPVKFMGGMTVSDYNFFSMQGFIMCKPDKDPTDLMDPDDLKHKFQVSKDWKIDLVTH